MANDRKKILITGAAGLIGRELCNQLSPYNDVTAVDNNQRFQNYRPESCLYIKSNLKDYLTDAVNNFDVIYHLAATNGTTHFYSHPNDVLRNNTTLDLAMFKFAESNSNSKLVYASSSEVVAGTNIFPTPEVTDISIDNIHNARWSYMLPKALAENYLFNSQINFLIIRFFNVFSEHTGAGHFVRDVVDKIKDSKFELIGAEETRSFCYVTDAVNAMIRIESLVSRDIVNIGSDEEIKIIDAATLISDALGVTVDCWKTLPGNIGSVARRCPDISKLRILYPDFSPRSFKETISSIKDRL
jgi:UDP-glucose 4-epimerase